MSIFLILLFASFTANAAPGDPVACTGGQAAPDEATVDYGGMTCREAVCDISADPSLGCTDSSPPIPPTNTGDAQRCYPLNTPYAERLYITTNTTFYDINSAGLTSFCAANPIGYDPVSGNEHSQTDSSDSQNIKDYRCYEMQGSRTIPDEDTVTRLCNLY